MMTTVPYVRQEIPQEIFIKAEAGAKEECERGGLPMPALMSPGNPWTPETWYAAWSDAALTARRAAGVELEAGRSESAMQFYRLAALCYRTAGWFLEREPPDPRNALCNAGDSACLRAASRTNA